MEIKNFLKYHEYNYLSFEGAAAAGLQKWPYQVNSH